MLWQIIFLAAGILSLIYYSVICVTLKKWDSTFSRFWLVLGVAGIAGSRLTVRYGMPCVVELVIGIGVFLLLISEIGIVRGMHDGKEELKEKSPEEKQEKTLGKNPADPEQEIRWIIVLGAQVQGRKITDSLKRRLDAALIYLQAHPDVKVIVSGGQGKDEEVSEAFAMAEYLKKAGIAKERIILEDASVNTMENLKFSRDIIQAEGGGESPVGIVSNNFHVYRGCEYARRAGFPDVFPIAADCNPVLFPNYFIRECFAVWKLWLKK